MSREEGRALATQIKSFVSGEIARRTSEIEPPEVKLTTYATVDTTAIGEALRGLAPLIEQSLKGGDEARDAVFRAISDALSGWSRDDAAIAKAIEGREVDLSPLAAAIGAIKVPDHSRELIQLGKDIASLVAASDRQTAAIKDQTARLEAAAKLGKTVSYDAAGRVKQIKVG
jgi:hypothetical protein